MNRIIGREPEIEELRRYERSGKPEFIALFGRRRVGKTFLIQQMYSNDFCFSMTGSIDGNLSDQLTFFNAALVDFGYTGPRPSNWVEAFGALKNLLASKTDGGRLIVFIDELPCLDTPRSGFVKALAHFWNSWGANNPRLMLIVCGSATSWMVKNILDNRGGLHNRITHEIHLAPFNLKETEQYLEQSSIDWDRFTIAQAYMCFGGIPYYLGLLNPQLSLNQNIDRLFFNENGELRREYTRLYRSLFRNPEPYTQVIEVLASKREGMTREELLNRLNGISAGKLSSILEDLKYCDFVRYYNVRSKKIKKTDGIYQLIDFFTIFYLSFCKQNTTNPHYWVDNQLSAKIANWHGLAFERLCMSHIPQIKKALDIERQHSEYYSWRADVNGKRAQIDMLIERADKCINLCEIKYSLEFYSFSKEEADKLLRRISLFRESTGWRHVILPTLVTTYGLAENKHSSVIKNCVTLEQLFV